MRYALLPLLLLCCLCTCVRAQSPVSFGQSYTIEVTILNEERTLNVLLPTDYQDSTEIRYPVIYLLDGGVNEDFFHVAGLVRYYQDHGMMPPTILVGIANTDRKRDMTYPSSDPRDQADFPTSGGSANFIRFLQTELTDWTEATFRTTSHRTLIGQSLGGLLATEILLKHPGHFNDYIIVSPSLWWDHETLNNQTDSLVNALTVAPDRLFASAGTEYPVMVEGPRKLARLLSERTNAVFRHLPDEDHNTILHEALNRAFDEWYDPTVIRPYYYANARSGLRLRSGPSLDSGVVGTLAYGDPLGVISAKDSAAMIDGLSGRWTYVGSDAGRGWVFDAYLSPVPVFDGQKDLRIFATETLGLTLTESVPGLSNSKEGHSLKLFTGSGNAKFIEHYWYEVDMDELQVDGLSKAQAQSIVGDFLGDVLEQCSLKWQEVWPGMFELAGCTKSAETSDYTYTFMFQNGLLSIRRSGWFVRSFYDD